MINLKSRATFSFPPDIAPALAGASPEDLAEVEVTPSGDGLHWEKLDADFSVPALWLCVSAGYLLGSVNVRKCYAIALPSSPYLPELMGVGEDAITHWENH